MASYTVRPDRLQNLEFARHNDEVRQAWQAFNEGRPYRVPIILGTNTRFFMFHPDANEDGLTFKEYAEDPDRMFEAQLRFQRWSRFNLLQDAELGLPDAWRVGVDFQNYYEAAWLGAAVEYMDGEVPDARPAFADCPERVMERGLPDPFGGLMARALEFHERMTARAARETFLGRPIQVNPPGCGLGSDGPLTLACSLFTPATVCTLMACEPDRLAGLMEYLTEATIRRMRAWRDRFAIAYPQDGFGFADDSVALISTGMYRDHVLPWHRCIYDAFATPRGRSIHLCGDSTRHFLTLRDELNVTGFDTGFPVDFGALRATLGPTVRLFGGPHVELLRCATPDAVRAEVRRILSSGVLEGGMFVLREGNNLAPGTPLENTEAMYHAGREYGRIQKP